MVHLLLPLYPLRLSHFVCARHVHHSCSQCTSSSLFIEFSDDTVILGLSKDDVEPTRTLCHSWQYGAQRTAWSRRQDDEDGHGLLLTATSAPPAPHQHVRSNVCRPTAITSDLKYMTWFTTDIHSSSKPSRGYPWISPWRSISHHSSVITTSITLRFTVSSAHTEHTKAAQEQVSVAVLHDAKPRKQASRIVMDPSHSAHCLLTKLSSSSRFRSSCPPTPSFPRPPAVNHQFKFLCRYTFVQ